MNIKIAQSILAILAIIAHLNIQAFIYDIIILTNSQTGQLIFLMKDQHVGQLCGSQKNNIIDTAQKLGAHVIVEDMLFNVQSCNSRTELQFRFFADNTETIQEILKDPISFNPNKLYSGATDQQTPLIGMTHDCKIHNVEVTNVECRFLTNLWQASFLKNILTHIEGKTIYAQAINLIETCQAYNDGPIYNEHYKEACRNLTNLLNTNYFRILLQNSGTIDDILITHEQALKQAKKEYAFDYILRQLWHTYSCSQGSSLAYGLFQSAPFDIIFNMIFACYALGLMVDCNILHSIATTAPGNHIIVAAGGAHIENILPTLLKSGYTVQSITQETTDSRMTVDISAHLAPHIQSQEQKNQLILALFTQWLSSQQEQNRKAQENIEKTEQTTENKKNDPDIIQADENHSTTESQNTSIQPIKVNQHQDHKVQQSAPIIEIELPRTKHVPTAKREILNPIKTSALSILHFLILLPRKTWDTLTRLNFSTIFDLHKVHLFANHGSYNNDSATLHKSRSIPLWKYIVPRATLCGTASAVLSSGIAYTRYGISAKTAIVGIGTGIAAGTMSATLMKYRGNKHKCDNQKTNFKESKL